MMLTEPTQTKRKREDLTKHKEPKRPKNKHEAQKHKPQHSNQSSSKQAEPEPKRSLNRHPITVGAKPQSRFKLEVYPSSKIGGSLTASDLDRELLFCPEVSVTALRALGGGVVVETATAEATTIAKRYLEGKAIAHHNPLNWESEPSSRSRKTIKILIQGTLLRLCTSETKNTV